MFTTYLLNLYKKYLTKNKNIYLFADNDITCGSLYYFMRKAHISFSELDIFKNYIIDEIESIVTSLHNCKNYYNYNIIDISEGSYSKLIENINTKLNVTFENDFLNNVSNITAYYCKNNFLLYILNCNNIKYFLVTNQYSMERFYNFCTLLEEKKGINNICQIKLNKKNKIKL